MQPQYDPGGGAILLGLGSNGTRSCNSREVSRAPAMTALGLSDHVATDLHQLLVAEEIRPLHPGRALTGRQALEATSPDGDWKSETTTREKRPQKRLFC